MIWWQTLLSCIYHVNAHGEHFLVRILRTYCCRLIQPVKMYLIWYMMWYLKKDMFCKEHDLFGWFVIFITVCPSSIFLVSLAIVHHPADTFRMELVCASVRSLIFMIVRTIVFSNRMHDRTDDFFGPSRVWTPGLAHDLFCWSRVWFPDLAAWFFVGPGFDSQTRSPVSGLWYPWPMSLAPTIRGSGWLCRKIKPSWGKKS